MILRGGKRGEGCAVGKREQRTFGALEHFLDNDRRSCLAKLARKTLTHAFEGHIERLGHDDAFTCSQTIGFNNDGGAHLAHVGLALSLVGKAAVAGCWHTSALHYLFGKLLRTLHASTCSPRAKGGDTLCAKGVCNTCNERSLWSNYNETNSLLAGKVCNRSRILRVDIGALGQSKHATVAWRNPHLPRTRRLGELGEQRVFAPPRAQKQDVYLAIGCHGGTSLERSCRATTSNLG